MKVDLIIVMIGVQNPTASAADRSKTVALLLLIFCLWLLRFLWGFA